MKPQITVVSLSPKGEAGMGDEAVRQLHSGKKLVLRTGQHTAARELMKDEVPFVTLDSFYGKYEDFDQMYMAMARSLWATARVAPLVYAVPDYSLDGSLPVLLSMKPDDGEIRLIPSMTTADCCMAEIGNCDWANAGVHVVSASNLEDMIVNPQESLLILETGNIQLAGDVKLHLMKYYDDETHIYVMWENGEGKLTHKEIGLYMLDREKNWDHTSAVFVPRQSEKEMARFTLSHAQVMNEKYSDTPEDIDGEIENMRQEIIGAARNMGESGDISGNLAKIIWNALSINTLMMRRGEDTFDCCMDEKCREIVGKTGKKAISD